MKISDLPVSTQILGITSDSREVKPGFIFVAVRGVQQDGHDFIQAAEEKGAAVVIGEKDASLFRLKIPYLKVKSAPVVLAELSADYFNNPSASLLVIGVTGTSGKTTTTYLLESILTAAGHQVGLIGTVNIRYGTQVIAASHTTPSSVELHRVLSKMKAAGCTAVIMEVSSHALKQRRVDSVYFDGVLFTNLSAEHLDYHPDMEDYFFSKSILFTDLIQQAIGMGKKPIAVVNGADPYGARLLSLRAKPFHSWKSLNCGIDGIQGELGDVSIRSPLVGLFNAENISGAVTLAVHLGIPNEQIALGVSRLRGVPGRLERVPNEKGIHIWVDYAHKPDALEKVIKTLREVRKENRLITVFGCGGDRDKTKRPVMGRIAVQWSDHVWITSDNPRTEDPSVIINEIVAGVGDSRNFSIEVDRRKAIFEAVKSASKGDLILIAGKGHEDYQILGTKKVHFDDREVANEAIRC